MQGIRSSKARLLEILRELDDAPGEWTTVYLTAASLKASHPRLVQESTVDRRLLQLSAQIEDEALQRELERYRTGLVLFASSTRIAAVAPPFPVERDQVTVGSPNVAPLRSLLQAPRRTMLVLVTWGAYVLALYDDESLVRHKKGTGHIHPPHKKGGSSQARFARRTEGQRAEFLRRVGGHIDHEFGREPVDDLFFGGNRLILKPLTFESRFLRDNAALLSPRVLLITRATLDTLPGALLEAHSAMIFLE